MAAGEIPAKVQVERKRVDDYYLAGIWALAGDALPEIRTAVRTIIVDEAHAVCENKRGVHLAVSLERLQAHVDGPLQRIGCSATLHPLEDIAAYLVGSEEGEQRPCTIVNAGMRKNLDVQVQAPVPDFLEASNTALWSSTYELLLTLRKTDTPRSLR